MVLPGKLLIVSRRVTLTDSIGRLMTKLPWTVMLICRQGSQSCLAEQHKINLSCTCVTFTVSSRSGKAAAYGGAEERRVFLL